MARPNTYHENIGCHNCKYYRTSTPLGLCMLGERNEKMYFDGYEDDLDAESWDRIFKQKTEFKARCEVEVFGHCAEWKRTDL